MARTVKCQYKYCKHESRDIPKDEAVKGGRQYFHADCFKERSEKEEVVKLFLEKINPNSPVMELRRVVNNIIHTKGIDSGFLLFGLKYYIQNDRNLNYPAGLYYVVGDKKIEEEWNKLKYASQKYDFNLADDGESQTFVYSKPKKKSLDNFMEG